jgi:hypothetical protein
LRELKAEFEAGQSKLAEVEGQANNLRTTMLRISGAIQVLEEELAKASGPRLAQKRGNRQNPSRPPGFLSRRRKCIDTIAWAARQLRGPGSF